jgi:hypothetical protein
MKGSSHLLLSFPQPKRLKRELKSSTLSPGSKDYLLVLLSRDLLVFSLYIFALWYAFSLYSSSSPNCICLLIPAVGRSIFHFLIA